MSTIHSIDFREGYKKRQALAWLKHHDIHPIKEHITKEGNKIISIRYRILDPKLFKRFTTKSHYDDHGKVNIIIGYWKTNK